MPTPVSVRIGSSPGTPGWCPREVLGVWKTHVGCRKLSWVWEQRRHTEVVFSDAVPARPPGKGGTRPVAANLGSRHTQPEDVRFDPETSSLQLRGLPRQQPPGAHLRGGGGWGRLSGKLGGGTRKCDSCLVICPSRLPRHLRSACRCLRLRDPGRDRPVLPPGDPGPVGLGWPTGGTALGDEHWPQTPEPSQMDNDCVRRTHSTEEGDLGRPEECDRRGGRP